MPLTLASCQGHGYTAALCHPATFCYIHIYRDRNAYLYINPDPHLQPYGYQHTYFYPYADGHGNPHPDAYRYPDPYALAALANPSEFHHC